MKCEKNCEIERKNLIRSYNIKQTQCNWHRRSSAHLHLNGLLHDCIRWQSRSIFPVQKLLFKETCFIMFSQTTKYGPVRTSLTFPTNHQHITITRHKKEPCALYFEMNHQMIASDPPWYESVVSSGVQRVDVTVGIIEGAVPKMFGQLKRHLPLCQCHLFTVPDVNFTTKVKHKHL